MQPTEAEGIDVRTMQPLDSESVRRLQVEAFGGDESIGRLLDALRGSWAWEDELSFVAVSEGRPVGHVLFTHAFLDSPSRLVDVLVMGPVGVRPEWQRRGVGSALITAALDVVGRRPESVVFVEGDPRLYTRFGFRPGAECGFSKPSDRIPDGAFMALLMPSHEPQMTGRLVYPDAFWREDAVGLR